MRKAAATALAVILLVSVTVLVIAARYRYGSVLDDLEGPLRPVEWVFDAGKEFSGASGGFARNERSAHRGSYGGEIHFDFSRGGKYVQVLYNTRYRGPIHGLRLWVRGSAGNLLSVRAKDVHGQVFQKELGIIPAKWTQVNIRFDNWSESWGGINDGVLRQPVIGIALVVTNSSPQPSGSVCFDDVERLEGPDNSPMRRRLPPHPRLLVSANELMEARKRVRTEPWAREMLEQLEQQCRVQLRRPLVVPDRGGQCEHWYACPEHGAALRTEGPHRHVCPVGGEVYSGWPYDDVAIALEHKRLRRLVRDAAVLYALTGRAEWARVVRSILIGYAKHYPTYVLHDIHGAPGRGGRAWAQSLDEAVWLVHLTQAADLVWAALTPEEQAELCSKLVRPAVNTVIRANRMRFHNIQCWHNAAVGLAGYLMDDQDMVAEAIDGARGYHAQLRHMVNQDGQWAEGSWGYHFYALEPLLALAEAAFHCGEDLYTDTLRNMLQAPLLAAMPDGSLPAFNDAGQLYLRDRDEYETALRRFGDPRFAGPLLSARRPSLRALLHGVRPLPHPPPVGARSRLLPDSGYAILSHGAGESATWVCVKYGPHGGDHGHPDKNNLVLYQRRQMLLGDPGVGAYLTPLADGWYKTTVAHNTVAADEHNQRPATGRLLAFSNQGSIATSLTDAGSALGPVQFRRMTTLVGQSALVVVDLLHAADGRSRTLDLVWHPSGRWADLPASRPLSQSNREGYRYLMGLRETTGTSVRASSRIQSGSLMPMVVVASGVGTYFFGTGVGSNTADRVPILIARQRASSCAFATVFMLSSARHIPAPVFLPCTDRDGLAVPLGRAIGLRVEMDGVRYFFVANPDGLAVRCRSHATSERWMMTEEG